MKNSHEAGVPWMNKNSSRQVSENIVKKISDKEAAERAWQRNLEKLTLKQVNQLYYKMFDW